MLNRAARCKLCLHMTEVGDATCGVLCMLVPIASRLCDMPQKNSASDSQPGISNDLTMSELVQILLFGIYTSHHIQITH